MKISFRSNIDYMLDRSQPAIYAEFDVAGTPTDKQLDDILEYVVNKAEHWKNKHGNISGFDYVQCCKNACKANGVEIIEKSADMIFYI